MTSAPCRPLRSNARANCALSSMRARLMHCCNGLETFETRKAHQRYSLTAVRNPTKPTNMSGAKRSDIRKARKTTYVACDKNRMRTILMEENNLRNGRAGRRRRSVFPDAIGRAECRCCRPGGRAYAVIAGAQTKQANRLSKGGAENATSANGWRSSGLR